MTAAAAFTLVEAVVSLAIGAFMLLALYASFAAGFAKVEVTRDDVRATQIILKRLEGIRLCTFDQVQNIVTNPPTLTDCFDPTDQAAGSGGVTYLISYDASTPSTNAMPDAYRTNMLLVTVTVSWTNSFRNSSTNISKLVHRRLMQTYVARNGMQSYVFGQ
jgi:type II secretory pathway pseudopilin PulG